MNTLRRCKPLLGTYVETFLQGDVNDDVLIQQSNIAFSAIQDVHDCMSFHDPCSELSQVNQHALDREVELSDSMFFLLSQIHSLHELSDGLFDPTIANELIHRGDLPSPTGYNYQDNTIGWQAVEINTNAVRFHQPLLIDLGGIAKGYAVDKAIENIDESIEIIINAGGDIRMSHWQNEDVSIAYSELGETKLWELSMRASAVASSASYYNNDNSVIIDPIKKSVVEHRDTVSVFANTCLHADALTKIVWLNNNPEMVLKKLSACAVFINANKVTYID